jgi:hypothetical protein
LAGYHFFVITLTLATAATAADTHDIVGIGWWGTSPLNGRYWFPASLQWCLNSSGGPFLVEFPCKASTTPLDQLGFGADQLLAGGSRVIYITLNANPAAFYLYTRGRP